MVATDFSNLAFRGFLISVGVIVGMTVVLPIITPLINALLSTFTTAQIPEFGVNTLFFLIYAALFTFLIVSFTLKRPANFQDWLQFLVPAIFLLIIFPFLKDLFPQQTLNIIGPAYDSINLAVREGMTAVPILNQLVTG